MEGLERRGEDCREESVDFGQNCAGKMIVIRAEAPDTVLLALKDDKKIVPNSEIQLKLEQ